MMTLFQYDGGNPAETVVTTYSPIRGRHLTLDDLKKYILDCNCQSISALRKEEYRREIEEEVSVKLNMMLHCPTTSCPCQNECQGGYNFTRTPLCQSHL